MKFYFFLIAMPIIGGFIGWITNLLAIKLIFWPIQPINIFGIKFQGIIPKRRFEIAKNIGIALESEILSFEEFAALLTSSSLKYEILDKIKYILNDRIIDKLPLFIPKKIVSNFFNEAIDYYGMPVIEDLKNDIMNKAREEIKIGKLVEEKINSFDIIKLEELIIKLSKRELRQIEILGGLIGFFIGLLQALVSVFLKM
ncbi:DUF445 domain-containing protein [Thermovenabulum gondwanense]|uniref:DUF445 domain-containing protein n=1 Tax=Thermovenabulum gondwanense TaxID=520767 RepID=UPI001FE0074E|nr:DUF445 family protein [Thermovenabulum gondwanense]